MKKYIYILISLCLCSISSQSAENVERAVKGRDMDALIGILKQGAPPSDAKEDAAELLPAAEVDPVEVAPVENPKAKQNAREALKAIQINTEVTPAPVNPVVKNNERTGDKFSQGELDQIRGQLERELENAKSRSVQINTDSSEDISKAVNNKTSERSKSLFSKIFSNEKTAEAINEHTEARDPSDPSALSMAKAAPAANISSARPTFERPKAGPRNLSMKKNRSTLDSMLSASREEVIRHVITPDQAGGQGGSVSIVDDEEWKNAGPDAWRYNGEWKDGTMHGQGRMIYADGWEYVGGWKNGTMDGQGTLNHPDGTVYEGQWNAGRMHGLGKLTYPDGWQFIGQWIDGKIQGQGTLINPGE